MRTIQLTKAAAAVTLALSAASAHAVLGITFDPDGSGASFGNTTVATFDWGSANVLARNCITAPASGATDGCTIYVQSKLTGLLGPTPGEANRPFDSVGHEFTMVLSVKADSSQTAPGNAVGTVLSFTDLNLADVLNNNTGAAGSDGLPDLFGDTTSSFKIYYDVANTNVVEGTGFTNGSLILEGSVGIKDFALAITKTLSTPKTPLDSTPGSIGVSHPTVETITTTGSANFVVDVNPTVHFIDTTFFKDPFTAGATLLRIDIDDNGRSSSPFTSTEPSKLVGGFVPNYGGDTGTVGLGQFQNDFDCDGLGKGAICDLHLEGDPKSIFQQEIVPEPSSVALIGLGLGLLGFGTRKWRSRQA